MNGDDRDVLLEAVASASRERNVDGRILPPPEWWDLSPDDRERAFELQAITRELERAANDRGWSGTVRAVMERI